MGIENKFTTPSDNESVGGLENAQEEDIKNAIVEGQEILSGILENHASESVEKGESFLNIAKETLDEIVKNFFSLPENGKVKNIILKLIGGANIAMWTKIAMDQRFNEIFVSPSDKAKSALACLVLGLCSATPWFVHALYQVTNEKRRDNPDYKF
jgi:hypothetical protein